MDVEMNKTEELNHKKGIRNRRFMKKKENWYIYSTQVPLTSDPFRLVSDDLA